MAASIATTAAKGSSSSSSSSGSGPNEPQEEDDVDRCAICLDEFEDKAVLDRCFHAFCFECILTWSATALTCPLCKTPFMELIHQLKSDRDYKVHRLHPRGEHSGQATRSGTRSQMRAGRPQRPQRPRTGSNAEANLDRRRRVYAENATLLPVEFGNHRPRSLSASALTRQEIRARLVPWIRRELLVLVDSTLDNISFLETFIVQLIQSRGLQDPANFTNDLRRFLFGHTEKFLDELYRFASSPWDMITYDQLANYAFPNDTQNLPDFHFHQLRGGSATERYTSRQRHRSAFKRHNNLRSDNQNGNTVRASREYPAHRQHTKRSRWNDEEGENIVSDEAPPRITGQSPRRSSEYRERSRESNITVSTTSINSDSVSNRSSRGTSLIEEQQQIERALAKAKEELVALRKAREATLRYRDS